MENIIEIVKKYGIKGIIIVVLLSIIAYLATACGIAKSGISGDRVVDKNVKDSVHYEVILEK